MAWIILWIAIALGNGIGGFAGIVDDDPDWQWMSWLCFLSSFFYLWAAKWEFDQIGRED